MRYNFKKSGDELFGDGWEKDLGLNPGEPVQEKTVEQLKAEFDAMKRKVDIEDVRIQTLELRKAQHEQTERLKAALEDLKRPRRVVVEEAEPRRSSVFGPFTDCIIALSAVKYLFGGK